MVDVVYAHAIHTPHNKTQHTTQHNTTHTPPHTTQHNTTHNTTQHNTTTQHTTQHNTTHTEEWLMWFTPMLLAWLWNGGMYFLILQKFRHSQQHLLSVCPCLVMHIDNKHRHTVSGQKKRLKHVVQRKLLLYLLVFVVCWIFDLASHVVSETQGCEMVRLQC